MPFYPDKFLESFGFTKEGETRLKLGGGVVTHTTRLGLALMAAIVAVCYALKGPALFGVIAILVGVFALYLIGTWWFADLHPDLALMGGAEFLQYHKMQMAAQHPEIMSDSTLTQPLKIEHADSETSGETDA